MSIPKKNRSASLAGKPFASGAECLLEDVDQQVFAEPPGPGQEIILARIDQIPELVVQCFEGVRMIDIFSASVLSIDAPKKLKNRKVEVIMLPLEEDNTLLEKVDTIKEFTGSWKGEPMGRLGDNR